MTLRWETASLGELCSIVAGGTPSRSQSAYWDGDIPWVKISDMLQGEISSTDERITQLGLDSSAAKLLPAGTVLLSIFATVGRTAVLSIDAATNQAIVGLILKDTSRVDPTYFRRYLDFIAAELEARARGVAQANINASILRAIRVPIPPLAEQRRIAAILDQADALRAKRRAALAQLDALAQSIFLEMFGDPVTNPKGWPTARLGDVVAVNPRVSSQAVLGEHSADSLVAFVPMAAVSESKRRVTDYEMRAIGEVAKGYTPFQRDDVLLAKITPCFENGKLCWVRDLPTAIGFGSTEFHVFRAPDPCVARFVFSLLSLSDLRERGARAMKGAAGQKRVPADFFADMKIPTPPASLLAQLDAKCAAIDLLRNKASTESVQLTDLFESLQHRAFRGEL